MKCGQLIEYTREIKNHEENEGGRLASDFSLLFKKALYEVKASSLQLSFSIFREPSKYNKINCIKI